MADETLPIGQQGNKKLLQDQLDNTVAEVIAFKAFSSALDSFFAVQGTPGVLGSPWFFALTDGAVAAYMNPDGGLRTNLESGKATYSAAALGIVPGTAATDIFTIRGAAGKTVKVTKLTLSGTATATGIIDVALIKRSALDTSGTPGVITAVPHNANFAAAVATVEKWTSTPPSTGAAVGAIRTQRLVLANVTTPVTFDRIVWEFAKGAHAPTLLTAVEQLAVNLNGATIQSGNLIDAEIEWTEE